VSCIISELEQIVDSIFAVNSGCFSLMHSFGVNPKIQDCEIWHVPSRCTGSEPVEKESQG